MTINQIQDEIIEEFSSFEDWMDRYSLLIEMGNELAPFPEEARTEQNLIDGCQSRVWFTATLDKQPESEGKEPVIRFLGDSDAILVKGIVALLIRVLSGHTPREIMDADLYFIDRIQLREHLSPTRSNGLVAMLNQMRNYARVYQSRLA
ncbi:MAG: SufE family protein [Paludibacteraceae bacterium]|nr:SufE family protein [Paludibacteraceae bacterium]